MLFFFDIGADAILDFMAKLPDEELLKDIDSYSGLTPLHVVFLTNSFSIAQVVEKMLERISDDDLVIKDKGGKTPLHYAVNNGRAPCCHDTKVLTMLLDRLDYDKLIIQDNDGNTPLHYAVNGCFDNHYEGIKKLLERLKPEDIFIKNNDGKVAMDMAKHGEIKELLKKVN